jgi:hypothetical protein
MARDATTARNRGESIGKGVEQAAEFLIPSTMAAKAVPLARGAVPATRLLARMGTEAALTAPLAAAHGDNPVVAGGIAAALPGAGKVLEPVGEAFITRALKPTAAHLREMTGSARQVAEKTKRVVDAAIKHRIMGGGQVENKLASRMDDINDIFAGPAGDLPSNVHLRLPTAVQEFKDYFRGNQAAGVPGVPMSDEGAAVADSLMPEILRGPAGRGNPPPVNLPPGMQASWPPRALRDDITARESYALGKGQGLENKKTVKFGEHGTPSNEGKKRIEMTFRNAAKDAADLPQGGVTPTGTVIPPNNLKPLFGETTELIDVRKALQNAPSDMPRTAAGEVVAGTSKTANLAMRALRAIGLPAGQLTHMAGEGLQGRGKDPFLDALMRALLIAGPSGATGDDR